MERGCGPFSLCSSSFSSSFSSPPAGSLSSSSGPCPPLLLLLAAPPPAFHYCSIVPNPPRDFFAPFPEKGGAGVGDQETCRPTRGRGAARAAASGGHVR
eukprot:6674908-Pyramimonas_sp.AAC.1